MVRRSGEGAPLRLVAYPGAHHSFTAAHLRNWGGNDLRLLQ